jgi:hypothetical protein
VGNGDGLWLFNKTDQLPILFGYAQTLSSNNILAINAGKVK